MADLAQRSIQIRRHYGHSDNVFEYIIDDDYLVRLREFSSLTLEAEGSNHIISSLCTLS